MIILGTVSTEMSKISFASSRNLKPASLKANVFKSNFMIHSIIIHSKLKLGA